MRRINSKAGPVFTWYDFVKPKKNKASNTTKYLQSNTKLEGYSQRHIGLHVSHNDNIYIAVALLNKNKGTSNWWRFIIESRLQKVVSNGGNIAENDAGVTMVPLAFKDLLYKDPYAYQNLYGMIDPTYLDMAVKQAMLYNQEMVEKAYDARRD